MPEEPPPNVPAASAIPDDHPLSVANRAGYGPLSGLAREVWHGQSAPCASCGRLNRRGDSTCEHCDQNLGKSMLEKMAKHSGPWFVYDPIRPFPGVSIERIDRQIRRGVLTGTSIVRGPTTYYQWRYAAETPLVAKLLGTCWSCQSEVLPDERFCPECKVTLDGHYRSEQVAGSEHPQAPEPQASEPQPASPADPGAVLSEFSKVVRASAGEDTLPRFSHHAERPLGKTVLVFLIIAVVVVGLIVALVALSQDTVASAAAAPLACAGSTAPDRKC